MLDKTILKIHDDCVTFLKKHKQIIIVKADKGGSSVAMLLSDYNDKMAQLLNDNNTYELHNTNPLNKLESESNKLINRLRKEDVIDDITRRRMIRYNTQLPRIYALPKIHKNDIPLRPIISTINSPSTILSCYIDDVLRCLLHDKYDIVNSKEMRERIQNVRITRNDALVSFDVISLFPSIPMDLVFDMLNKKWNLISQKTRMSKDLFFDILRFILIDSTFFDYEGSIYKQINGCAMGSNISPTIANIVTNELLDTVISKLPFKLKIMTKYVDDIFAIIPKRQLNNTLRLLNSYNQKIQFTMEVETEDQLPYLDLLLIREENKIITNWYRKPTAANNTLNFLSNHPMSMRTNVAFNMFYRALSLSDQSFHANNIKQVRKILQDNNYPVKVINHQMNKCLQKLSDPPTITPSPTTSQTIEGTLIRRSLTYDNVTSNILKRELTNGPNKNIQLAMKPYHCLRQTLFSNLKTKIKPTQKTHVVYKIPCNGVNGTRCDKSYVGQTRNQLHKRITQHRNDIIAGRNPNGQSAVVTHYTSHNHEPAFDKVKVLSTETLWSRRNTRESLHILSQNTYNLRRDTQNISASYCALIDRWKKKL